MAVSVAWTRSQDDNSSLFRPALTELHARGLLFGCGYRLACPDRTITRGEAAAFFHRVMGLPATSKDFFRDDGNSRFQNAINRLAAEGIVRGCAPRAFCPDRLLTRAEFAAMTVRALGLSQRCSRCLLGRQSATGQNRQSTLSPQPGSPRVAGRIHSARIGD